MTSATRDRARLLALLLPHLSLAEAEVVLYDAIRPAAELAVAAVQVDMIERAIVGRLGMGAN